MVAEIDFSREALTALEQDLVAAESKIALDEATAAVVVGEAKSIPMVPELTLICSPNPMPLIWMPWNLIILVCLESLKLDSIISVGNMPSRDFRILRSYRPARFYAAMDSGNLRLRRAVEAERMATRIMLAAGILVDDHCAVATLATDAHVAANTAAATADAARESGAYPPLSISVPVAIAVTAADAAVDAEVAAMTSATSTTSPTAATAIGANGQSTITTAVSPFSSPPLLLALSAIPEAVEIPEALAAAEVETGRQPPALNHM